MDFANTPASCKAFFIFSLFTERDISSVLVCSILLSLAKAATGETTVVVVRVKNVDTASSL
ncbi:hypothetical protein Btm27_05992 [Bacillus thuringiensis serovar mexicanensis]|nr:hypothetical protein Btm27_05992 [Bacillus thuringiensis serovar mexicanensis]